MNHRSTWQHLLDHQKSKRVPEKHLSSVQFSHSVVSNSLWPHGLQHSRPPCPTPTPRVYSNSCPLSQWCHPTISFSVVPFSSHLQSFPASVSFQMSQHQISFSVVPFSSHLQSFPASVSFQMSHIRWPKYWSFRFNISPSNEHSGLISFRMDWFDLLTVQGTLKSLCQHHSSKASILRCSRKMNLGSSLSVPYLFAFSCCLWGSQGKNTEVVCHSLLQWTTFCQNSLSWPICLGWPYMARLIVSLS